MFTTPKIVQILSMIQTLKGTKSISTISLERLLFLAERYHVRKNSKPLSGDQFYATDSGIVPMLTRDLLVGDHYQSIGNHLDFEKSVTRVKAGFISFQQMDSYSLLALTEQEAIAFAVENFMRFNELQLNTITKAFPEWKETQRNGAIDPKHFFENLDTTAISYLRGDPYETDNAFLASGLAYYYENYPWWNPTLTYFNQPEDHYAIPVPPNKDASLVTQVGFFGNLLVYVYGNEGLEPHFFIIQGNVMNPIREISLYFKSPTYFRPDLYPGVLTAEEKTALMSWINVFDIETAKINWNLLCATWQKLNNWALPDKPVIPDYTTLVP